MSEQPSHDLGSLDIELARRIDAICRRFEAEWRDGRRPRVEDYLADVPEEGRSALRAELEALEQELSGPAETTSGPATGPATIGEATRSPTITEVVTIAPADAATARIPVVAPGSGHDEATLHPRDEATVDLGTADRTEPSRIRYFGDYEIIRELARGGMGVVFRARQMSLNRTVALKMILAGQLANDIEVKRFYSEAEAAANLDHPGIVPIFEVGQHKGQHYFSMGFVEGPSLSQRLAEGPLTAREAAELIRRVSEAIAYAHQHGVIHRDLKPANILLDPDGNPRVTDFGLAKKVQGDSGLTGSGQIMGTPSYMPPEQAGGRRGAVGPAADVYALGATLYALVTGRPPFQAATPMDTVSQVINDEPVPPRRLNAALSRDLEIICLKCLEKEPGRRYRSATALAEDLRRYLAGEPIVARPVTPFEAAVKWARRNPVIAGLLGLVALVTALGFGGVLWQWREAVFARGVAERETERTKSQTKLAEERLHDAVKARAEEKKQTVLAELRLKDALEARAREREQTELAERRLYDVRMKDVQRYWEGYHGELFREGLDEQLPANQGGIDRRGFEWFYWRRTMASGHITLKGHTSSVTSVAFSPDGKRLASASDDQTVRLWDAATGRETLALEGHPSGVVAFSPDGRRLAAAVYKRTVKLWDVATGQELLTLKGHPSGVRSVAFSPDGKRLASASHDYTGGIVKLWDAATGLEEPLTLKGLTMTVAEVAFSPDGKRLACAGYDGRRAYMGGQVKLWDAMTGQELFTVKGDSSGASGVAFSPDGHRFASAGHDGMVKVWDAATGQQVLTLKENNRALYRVAFSPDGKWIAAPSGDQTVKVWDAATGQEIRTLKGHTNAVTSVAFSPDGKRIASASRDQTVKVWDVATGQGAREFTGHTGNVGRVAFSPDGRWIASASDDQTVKVWDAATGRETRTLEGHTDRVNGVAFSPDGKRIATAGGDQTVRVWDTSTGLETLTLEGHTGDAVSMAFSRLKGYTGDYVTVAFSPDGRRLASAGPDGTLKVWGLANGQETLTIKLPRLGGSKTMSELVREAMITQKMRDFNGRTDGLFGVAFSPDGEQLASAGQDGTVRIWDAVTGQETRTLYGHTGIVYSVVFSPDGKQLASAGQDGTVKVWDAATGHVIRTHKGHTDGVNSVAFSPDGKRLASSGWDSTVRVWDAATGLETLALAGGRTGVAFSPDGKRLASGGGRTVKLWDARPLDAQPPKPGPTPR